MHIIFEEQVNHGMELKDIPYGVVVTRPTAPDIAYMVASLMDGSGLRVLLSLKSGALKSVNQSTYFIPRSATLHVSHETTAAVRAIRLQGGLCDQLYPVL
jgi:hypothetical protein